MTEQIEVLVVDDNENMAKLTELMLERQNLSVGSTTDPTEVIALLEEESYNAVVCDYDMPVMNGSEVHDHVTEYDPSIPFVLYTGRSWSDLHRDFETQLDHYQRKGGHDQYDNLESLIKTDTQEPNI